MTRLNQAISVWSAVRVPLALLLIACTSATSVAYCALVKGGGPDGRNCDGEVIAHGVM